MLPRIALSRQAVLPSLARVAVAGPISRSGMSFLPYFAAQYLLTCRLELGGPGACLQGDSKLMGSNNNSAEMVRVRSYKTRRR